MNYADAVRIAYGDPAVADLNRYLAKLDREEQREAAIEALADTLFNGEYSPFLPENVSEAMGELTKDQLTELATGLRIKAFAGVGQALQRMVIKYWEDSSRRRAENMIEEQARDCEMCGCSRTCRRECEQ